jgi:hypothetical protein
MWRPRLPASAADAKTGGHAVGDRRRVLSGRQVNASWMASGPVHDDREPRLAVRDSRERKVLVCCHPEREQTRAAQGRRRPK